MCTVSIAHLTSEAFWQAAVDYAQITDPGLEVEPEEEVNAKRQALGRFFEPLTIGSVDGKLGGGKTVEGYIVGHELSHAASYLFISATQHNGRPFDFNTCNDAWSSILGCGEKLKEDNIDQLQILFPKAEEMRNLFGLRLPGERQFLEELKSDCIRIPYDAKDSHNGMQYFELVGLSLVGNKENMANLVNLFKHLLNPSLTQMATLVATSPFPPPFPSASLPPPPTITASPSGSSGASIPYPLPSSISGSLTYQPPYQPPEYTSLPPS